MKQRITDEEVRRRMAEILREQSERPTLRPSPGDEDEYNPFRGAVPTDQDVTPFEQRRAAHI